MIDATRRNRALSFLMACHRPEWLAPWWPELDHSALDLTALKAKAVCVQDQRRNAA